MRHMVLAGLLLCAGAGQDGEAWTLLDGAQIRAALEGRSLQYANARQEFRASGRTLYDAGSDSWGYWRVDRDRYCSQWPPSDLWACYTVERAAQALRFVGTGGDVTEATYAD